MPGQAGSLVGGERETQIETDRRLIAEKISMADWASHLGKSDSLFVNASTWGLMLTGRVQRALVLVPEPLIHQWFVELLRRFQLCFELFDESRCEAIESGDPDGNPFLDSQWVLAPLTGQQSQVRAGGGERGFRT